MGVGGRKPKQRKRDGEMVAALRSQVQQVHELLDEHVTVAAERTRSAPAVYSSVLSLYLHALCVEDATVNALLRNLPPLFTSTWTNGDLQPTDLGGLRDYAEAVHGATDFLVGSLTPLELQSAIDLRDAGLGQPDLSWVLNRFVLWETAVICGEVAAASSGRSSPTRELRSGRLA
jgi:hypothetical protein